MQDDAPPSEAGIDDATNVMNREQVDAKMRAASRLPAPLPAAGQPPQMRPRAMTQDLAPMSRTSAMPQNRQGPPPIPRQPGGGPGTFPGSRAPAMPSRAPAPESQGAIALPRPPVARDPGPGAGSYSRAPQPPPPATAPTRTMPPNRRATIPPVNNEPEPARRKPTIPPQNRSLEPAVPALDELVPPRQRSQHPRLDRAPSTRPPQAHRSQPPRDRPRFLDRTPEPRPPGYGLPGPDSHGRLPSQLPRFEAEPAFPSPSQFPEPRSGPEETALMARPAFVPGPRSVAPPPPQQGEYYPPAPQQPPPQQSRLPYSEPVQTYQRDPNEYYPHLQPGQSRMPVQHTAPQGGFDGGYPQMNPYAPTAASRAPTMSPSAMPMPSRVPLPGTAPYPAQPLEAPSFFGLVLFAAPLALATLAIVVLALM